MKKYLKISVWLLGIIVFVVLLNVISNKQQEAICTGVLVKFIDSTENQFIDRNDIFKLAFNEGQQVVGQPLKNLNLAKIEKSLNKEPYIKHAEVYKKIDGTLCIEAKQRIPFVRVINKDNISFYIGTEGILMPVSRKVKSRMLVASGEINYTPSFDTIVDINSRKLLKNKNIKTLKDLFKLVSYIDKNEFWVAQTQQIFINEKQEFEIIPLVGNHIIEFGGVERLDEKFANIEATYKKGFPAKGWNRYKKISLKYENQVICSKAE